MIDLPALMLAVVTEARFTLFAPWILIALPDFDRFRKTPPNAVPTDAVPFVKLNFEIGAPRMWY